MPLIVGTSLADGTAARKTRARAAKPSRDMPSAPGSPPGAMAPRPLLHRRRRPQCRSRGVFVVVWPLKRDVASPRRCAPAHPRVHCRLCVPLAERTTAARPPPTTPFRTAQGNGRTRPLGDTKKKGKSLAAAMVGRRGGTPLMLLLFGTGRSTRRSSWGGLWLAARGRDRPVHPWLRQMVWLFVVITTT
ncbi:hypothetical protein GQ53DRAFT_376424 [Thozetella sp. PMI_491]|nr:hypothetical protein GQ53DRAFT_376424 [Thozetella sp. PMI_491]